MLAQRLRQVQAIIESVFATGRRELPLHYDPK